MKVENGVAHYDVNDPADLKVLIENGLIWRGGPETQNKAITFLFRNPDVVTPEVLAKCPPNIVDILQGTGQPEPGPETPAEEVTPTEEPVEAPSAPSAEVPPTP